MNPRPTLLLCALALPGCGGGPEPDATTSAGSGGLTGSSGSAATSDAATTDPGAGTDAPTGGAATSGMSTGTGTSGHGTTTSSGSGEDPSTGPLASTGTGASGGTTGESPGPAPDWALLDVNANSASYDQLVSPSSYAGMVSGWYFTHAT